VLGNKLKTFVPVQAAAGLALEIDERFPKVSPKELLNALFDDIKTVGDLVDFVVNAEEA
jgi:acyl carrier protein